jgi:hypothetical protein
MFESWLKAAMHSARPLGPTSSSGRVTEPGSYCLINKRHRPPASTEIRTSGLHDMPKFHAAIEATMRVQPLTFLKIGC